MEILLCSKRRCHIAQDILVEIRQYVIETPFSSTLEEIQFFKEIKPLFLTPLIFNHKVYSIELNKPEGSSLAKQEYLQEELKKIELFYNAHHSFYQYCRSRTTDRDHIYYTRGHLLEMEDHLPYAVQDDPSFSTGYDYLLSRTQANAMLRDYLENALYILSHPGSPVPVAKPTETFTWTAPLIDLAELIYGIQAHACINNGKASDKAVTKALCSLFNVQIEFIAKKKEEIRMRKKNRTPFWDGAKRSIVRKMEEDDEHAL